MALTVLSVAYSLAPVFPDCSGGAEQVLSHLDEALVSAGHRSVVVACAGSRVRGTLISTGFDPSALLDERARARAEGATRDAVARALERFEIDVVHLHGIDFASTLPRVSVPTLVTLHLPIAYYAPEALRLGRSEVFFTCVSAAQHAELPPDLPRVLAPIENGIELSAYAFRRAKRRFALALGRICPEKGYDVAIEAARAAGVPLVLAGELFPYPSHRAHFEQDLLPRLDGAGWFAGPVRGERKRRLLAGARCLLVPSRVPETSSLVAMEALASGTPVVATPRGALRDYIEPGRNGFHASTADELAAAIRRVGAIDPLVCRRFAERRFDVERMGREYLDTYTRLARRIAVRTPSPGLDVGELRSLDAVASLASEWDALLDEVPSASVFQSFAWVFPWLRHLGAERVRVMVARRAGRLRGILPLVEQHGSIRIAGTGIGDTLDVLAPGAEAEGVAASVLGRLRSDPSWRSMSLEDVRDTSPLLASARALASRELDVVTERCSVCPVLVAAPEATSLRQLLPKKMERNLRVAQKLAANDGLVVERACTDSLDEHLSALFRNHGARWEARGQTGVLAHEAVEAFHRESARRLLARGELLLLGLRHGGRIDASVLAYLRGENLLFYLGGFQPALARYSPVTLLIGAALSEGLARGVRSFDFLRGTERYKYLWGARDREQHRVVLRRSPAVAHAVTAR